MRFLPLLMLSEAKLKFTWTVGFVVVKMFSKPVHWALKAAISVEPSFMALVLWGKQASPKLWRLFTKSLISRWLFADILISKPSTSAFCFQALIPHPDHRYGDQ